MTPAEAGLHLRPGTVADLPAVAEVHLASRLAAVPAMPPPVHPPPAVRAWVRGWDLAESDLWVALAGERVVGYLRLSGDWIDDLYVAPDAQRVGLGSMLLDLAKQLHPGGFGLWVFESNLPARAFYARHGLVETERTDGSENEERAPDIRVEWPGR